MDKEAKISSSENQVKDLFKHNGKWNMTLNIYIYIHTHTHTHTHTLIHKSAYI